MLVPTLTIGGTDYAADCLELKITSNDLDADGSGRDVQTGDMVRVKIAEKLKVEVSMDRLSATEVAALFSAIKPANFQASILDPGTGTIHSATFYKSAFQFGSQRYDRHTQQPYYDGVAFSMIEV